MDGLFTDSSNRFLVGATAGGEMIAIMNPGPLLAPIGKPAALILAAWLVALADSSPDHAEFRKLLAAVEST
jgi:hypothetical protein